MWYVFWTSCAENCVCAAVNDDRWAERACPWSCGMSADDGGARGEAGLAGIGQGDRPYYWKCCCSVPRCVRAQSCLIPHVRCSQRWHGTSSYPFSSGGGLNRAVWPNGTGIGLADDHLYSLALSGSGRLPVPTTKPGLRNGAGDRQAADACQRRANADRSAVGPGSPSAVDGWSEE